MEGDVHAKHNQEGSAGKAHVGSDLENTAESLSIMDQKITHNLECDQGLRTLTNHETGNKYGEADLVCTTVPTWQFIGVVTFKPTRSRIMAIRRAARASE